MFNHNWRQVYAREVLISIFIKVLGQGRVATAQNEDAVGRLNMRSEEVLELTVVLKPVILLLCLKSGVPVVVFKILCIVVWKRICHA